MTVLGLHRFFFRLGLLSILVAVLFQAMPSSAIPTYRERGSAFDATTYEVAVLVQRDEASHQALTVDPVIPRPPVPGPEQAGFAEPKAYSGPPKQTGPPLLRGRHILPPTRAPPILT